MGIDKNHYIDVDVNHDFGFTFANEDDVVETIAAANTGLNVEVKL